MAKDKRFNWLPNSYSAGFRADMPDAVTLSASPNQTVGFIGKPKRGTTWSACVSQWDESTSTLSRFGRDTYGVPHKTAKDAMRAAETAYLEAIEARA
jgi:hypothetical protein